MKGGLRSAVVLLVAVLAVGMLGTTAADAKPRLVAKTLPGYCGTVKAVYGPPLGVSVSSRRDRWTRTSKVSCARARQIARRYMREVGTKGQGSSGQLRVAGFQCGAVSGYVSQQTGHAGSCTRGKAIISMDEAAQRGRPLLPCSARRVAAGLRGAFTNGRARMVNHRCAGGYAVANVSFRGSTQRYAFRAFDGAWAAVHATASVLEGFSGPPNRLNLATVNALGRAMKGKRVEHYRVGR